MSSFIGVTIAAAAACCWGVVYASSQTLVTSKFTPWELLIACTMAGSLILCPFFVYNHVDLLQAEHEPSRVLSFTFILLAAEFLVFLSVRLLGGTEAGLIQVSYPIWTAVDLFLIHGERPSGLTVVGASLILLGVAYIALYGGNSDQANEHDALSHMPSEQPILVSAETREHKTSYSSLNERF